MSGEGRSPSALTAITDYSLPALSSATSHKIKVSREYKSGASYQGDVKDNQRCGLGLFAWPNGAKYEGEFIDNDRHGKGVQEWPDGSRYEGQFINNMRHGDGNHTWANGEAYVGRYFRDRRHGPGTYTWPDGSKYVGTFYMDKKEGYGTFYFANGKVFEGLYGSDERYGPGVLTYPDSTADVGLWHREKLVRLSAITPGAFTIQNHQEVEFFPEEHARFIDASAVRNRTDVVDHIVHPPEQFNYPPGADIEDMANRELFSDTLHNGSLAVDIQIFDEEFFKDVRNKVKAESIPEEKTMVKGWNNTPSSLAMQSHILRHESRSHTVSFSVQEILDGNRSNFAEKGCIEKASEEFLLASQSGDVAVTSDMLNKDLVYVDVCDMRGHTALLGSAVNWHQNVINVLLDNGADVNRTNNECVSALAGCHIHFYPVDCFKYNIAERYLKPPKDIEKEACYDANDSVKALIPTSPTKKRLVISTTERRGSVQPTPPSTKKIHKLRQEYRNAHMVSIQEGNKGGNDQEGTPPEEDKENAQQEEDEGEVDEEDEEDGTEVFLPIEEPLQPRTLGTLQVRRATKINLEDMLVKHPRMGDDIMRKMNRKSSSETFDAYSETEMSEFESIKSIRNLPIDVTDGLIERCATQLSQNDMVVGRMRTRQALVENMGTARRLAIDKSHHELMQSTIQLLLSRGADPNASSVPMPVLFYAIKAADVAAVRLLLMKGAATGSTLSEKKGGLCPLHIAAAIPGEEGIAITELLLNALSNPDARSALDDSFLNRSLEEEWTKDNIHPGLKAISGGRTPLHIACARDDSYKNACRVAHLLLAHHANPNLLCNGHSPLALAVSSGNDMAIDELLCYGADPCLPLTHGVGSALCIASNTEYEHRRSPPARIHLIDKLIRAGADILAPILIGPKRVMGTAVDYAYYMYNLDRRIAHMPYHALSPAERETYNARRRLLAHMGDVLRHKAVDRERRRLEEEERQGRRSISPSPNFTYTGAGAPLPIGIIKSRGYKGASATEGRVSFGGALTAVPTTVDSSDGEIRRPLFRYCYECGRSVGVRLSACTRCKEVYYCSKACKLKAWNARHKDECVRLGGRSCSPSPNRGGTRIDSPTPATDPDLGAPTTVAGIAGDHIANRIKRRDKGKKFKKQRAISDDEESQSDSNRYENHRDKKKKRESKSRKKKDQDSSDDRESDNNFNEKQAKLSKKSKGKENKPRNKIYDFGDIEFESEEDTKKRKGKGKKLMNKMNDRSDSEFRSDEDAKKKKRTEQKKTKTKTYDFGDIDFESERNTRKKKKNSFREEERIPDSSDSDSDEESGAKNISTKKKSKLKVDIESSSDSESSNDSSETEEGPTIIKHKKQGSQSREPQAENKTGKKQKLKKVKAIESDSDFIDAKKKVRNNHFNRNRDSDFDYLSDDFSKKNKTKARKKAWAEDLSDSDSEKKRKPIKSSQKKLEKREKVSKKKFSKESFDSDEKEFEDVRKRKKGKKNKPKSESFISEEEREPRNHKEKRPKDKKQKNTKENGKLKNQNMKLKLDLDDSDDEFSIGARRSKPSYDMDTGKKKPRKKKDGGKGQDPFSAEADWMSPRKHYQKGKHSRLDEDWLEMGTKKKKDKKKDKVANRWAQEGKVSMLHPKIERSKTTFNDVRMVKVHSKSKRGLPPIAESPSGLTHYSHMSPSMRVTMATMSQKARHHDSGHILPSPTGILSARSRTFPGAEGLRKENVKLKMRISVRAKHSVGRSDSGVAEHVVPYAMATAAISKVAIKGRSRSAVVRGPKTGGKYKDGLLPRLKNKAQTFHGVTTPQYALSIMPSLHGLQDLQRYKHIYVDNYSFN